MLSFTSSQSMFFLSLMAFIVGAFGSLFFMKSDRGANLWSTFFSIIGSALGLIFSTNLLLTGNGLSYNVPSSFAFFSFSFNVDRLSAFFIFVILLVAFISSTYGWGYVKHFYKKYSIGALGFFYNFFILGMLLVVSAHNAIFFLVAWEVMSLASYFLVIFERNEKSNIKAGTLYFIMTHVGMAFILFSFLLLFKTTGSFDFSVIKENISGISPMTKNLIFILALIGFGTKAGIIPLHIWLPSAHPAAPSHVSALMSGVMIKTGVYMIIRLFMDILPGGPLWWGALILIIGAISSLMGVLYALSEHDIKRLLAYHSIENIGIILMGVGSSMTFLALGMPSLAIIGLVAALFHVLNHATFKALLFLGAGSVVSKMHTRNIEEYGGLIKYMPYTAFFFLIGSMAISALPPFNGFFSEWMVFQSLFRGIINSGFLQWAFILAAGSLAFTGGLAAACFVKAFGTIFLARPRSEEVEQVKEVDFSLKLGMGILALLTLIIGVGAGFISSIISKAAQELTIFSDITLPFNSSFPAVKFDDAFSYISMPAIFLALALLLGAVYLVTRALTKDRKVIMGCTWDCGTNLNSRMEITATGFSRSIITIFKGILKPTKQDKLEYRDANSRYFAKAELVKLEVPDVYSQYIYDPIKKVFMKLSQLIKKIQNGNVNTYVMYMFIALVLLLLLVI